MLHTYRLKLRDGEYTVLSGRHGGKKVLCRDNHILKTFKDLYSLSENNKNYWAGLVVNSMIGLSAGRLHQDNIYIKTWNNLAYGNGVFYLVLPGIKATLEARDDGNYLLCRLDADMAYMAEQKAGDKPGLWRVPDNADAKPVFRKDGMIKHKEGRFVVIPDMSSDDVGTIARFVRKDIVALSDEAEINVRLNGFDLHHTPGGSGIVGLKKARRALADTQSREIAESAAQLANTMYHARNVDGVLWFADWGGAGVLTRALQILGREKNIKLENHAIYLNRPTTRSREIFELAGKIGMQPRKVPMKTGINPREIRGHILQSDVTLSGALKVGCFGISTAGAGYGLAAGVAALTVGTAGTVALIGAGVGFVGGMITASKTVRSGLKNVKGKQYK